MSQSKKGRLKAKSKEDSRLLSHAYESAQKVNSWPAWKQSATGKSSSIEGYNFSSKSRKEYKLND